MNGSVVGPSAVNCTNATDATSHAFVFVDGGQHLQRKSIQRRLCMARLLRSAAATGPSAPPVLCFSPCGTVCLVSLLAPATAGNTLSRDALYSICTRALSGLTNHPYGRKASLRPAAMHQTELLSSFPQSPAELIVKRRTPISSVT